MANAEQLALLKRGVANWNTWREEHRAVAVDLSGADLTEADLFGANLRGADLSGANLRRATLTRAALRGADLFGTDLRRADLRRANLRRADLFGADLSGANLRGADLTGAKLFGANLTGADLRGADLTDAWPHETVFADVDLSEVKGLDTCEHTGPSTIDLRTLKRSWPLPLDFLRGCGLPDDYIDYLPGFMGQAIQFYSCFISYSSRNADFAERLHADLQNKGVRCWFAPEDLKIGDKIRYAIDDAIRLRDKLLIVLSEDSIASAWVETEVETALEERERKEPVLFPIRLDDRVFEVKRPWARQIKNTRHIGDFTDWKDHDAYQNAFARLLRDLKPSG